jgi:hypothetical protein
MSVGIDLARALNRAFAGGSDSRLQRNWSGSDPRDGPRERPHRVADEWCWLTLGPSEMPRRLRFVELAKSCREFASCRLNGSPRSARHRTKTSSFELGRGLAGRIAAGCAAADQVSRPDLTAYRAVALRRRLIVQRPWLSRLSGESGDAGRPHRHRRHAFIDLRRQPWPCVPARPHPHRSFHCIPSRPVRRARAWPQGPQAWVG